MKKFEIGLCGVLLIFAMGCQRGTENPMQNFVERQDASVDRALLSDGTEFRVVSAEILKKETEAKLANSDPADLVLGFPKNLVGQQNVFGGVVTEASDHEDENVGNLKLSDVTPVHVKTALALDRKSLQLQGCKNECEEWSTQETLFSIPVVSEDGQYLYLDLKTFGEKLDFLPMYFGEEMPLEYQPAVATVVKRFDFSLATLVFDVENSYLQTLPGDPRKAFSLTTRWYLKLTSAFSPGFTARAPTDGVGFFTTMRNKIPLITRFSGTSSGPALMKYYVKNVPAEHQAAFRDSFEDWNLKLESILGKKLFEIVREKLGLVRKDCKRCVCSHRTDRFFAVLRHRCQQKLHIFLRGAKGLLAIEQGQHRSGHGQRRIRRDAGIGHPADTFATVGDDGRRRGGGDRKSVV